MERENSQRMIPRRRGNNQKNIHTVSYTHLEIIGYPKRIWKGGTDRGCIEAPHLTKRNGYYYIMCAEGGTGYNHCVTMGRSQNVWGPYEGCLLYTSWGYSLLQQPNLPV